MRLFCFPPAGGSRASFRRWRKLLPPGIELVAAEPPGRALQADRPPFRRLEPLLDHLARALGTELDGRFAFYGLSMGSIVAFELARRLRDGGHPGPAHLFVGGHRAPHLPRRFGPWHDMPEERLVEEVRALGGLPGPLAARPQLLAPLLTTLRADAEVAERYEHQPAAPLPCPITAFLGSEDPMVDRGETDAWREHGSGGFELIELACGHFPAGEAERRLVARIAERLGHADERLLS